jgi:[ribosomal protein S5]-alanine N-acetyltransferase
LTVDSSRREIPSNTVVPGMNPKDPSSGEAMFLCGERLYLREIRCADVTEGYHAWLNDPEVTHHLESRFFPNSVETLQRYVAKQLEDRDSLFLAIVLKEGHRHIGNVKLGPINWIHRLADIGILIGETDCWRKGYATETIRLLADHAFKELNLHKLTAGCYATNPASAAAFLHAGFIQEGVRKEHYYSGGVYTDLTLMGLIRAPL